MNYCSKNQAIKCNFQSIDLAITDARSNLLDSLRFASHDRAHGISIVFGGKVIAGTRAKKEFPELTDGSWTLWQAPMTGLSSNPLA